ncbi:MAG: hypothetical protein ACLP7Q_06575 [Isosphaeraceae bacterium]
MCSGLSMTSFDLFETLETKLSCSALVAHAAVMHDDNTPPAPEDDPGELPPDNEPIIYPPTPESGPVGPGSMMQLK